MLWSSALLCTSQTLSKYFFRLTGADSDFEKKTPMGNASHNLSASVKVTGQNKKEQP
jgi:hypothetical protein